MAKIIETQIQRCQVSNDGRLSAIFITLSTLDRSPMRPCIQNTATDLSQELLLP
jgi:hypothetical protein